MVGTKQWEPLVSMALHTGAKLIVCGDDHQYKAIDAGDIFRKVKEKAFEQDKGAELQEIFRQSPDWMKEASVQLSQLETTTALMAYENKGHVRELSTKSEMIQEMASQYLTKTLANPKDSGCVLTSTNNVRLELNTAIREQLQNQGLLGSDLLTYQGKGFAIGEKIVFLENDKRQFKVKSESEKFFVRNGTRGVIENIDPIVIQDKQGQEINTHTLTVRVSDTERVRFHLKDYDHFDHAYAVTGYKAQGQTLNWSLVHLNSKLEAYGLYVMMTRHRENMTLYHNKEEVESFSKFADNIRVGYKDLAIDYTITPENHEFFFNVEDYKSLGREIMQAIKSSKTEQGSSITDLLKERKDLARIIVDEKEGHRHFVMQAGLTFEKLEMTAGLKTRPLTLVEQKAQATVEQYSLVALEARDLWRDIRKTAPGHLAKGHQDYPRFEELKAERGSLSSLIMEAPALHRPFLKDVTKELGYGQAILQKQADAFQSKQIHQVLLQENKDPQVGKDLNVLASYIDARDQVSQLWKELKPELQKAEGSLLKPTLNKQIDALKDVSRNRDKLAYQIADRFEDYQPLSQSLQINLATPKLFEQAENGLRQICIEQYQYSNSQLAKSMAAFELSQLWQGEKEAGLKTTVRELLQNKINLLEIRAEAYKYERLELRSSLATAHEQKLFDDLSHYQELKETARDHFILCKQEAQEKDMKPWESSYYDVYKQVSIEKDASAYNLIKKPYNEISSLSEKMHVFLKTMDQDAHRHDLRQTADIYLSGMGAKSVFASQELQAWLDLDRETNRRQTLSVLSDLKILPRELRDHLSQKEEQFKCSQTTKQKKLLSDQTSKNLPSLNEALKERMGDLSQSLLGDPSSRSAFQYRYGRKGSLSVTVNGPQIGRYSNFETGTHGGPIKMIEEQLKLDSKEAVTWAKEWLGQALTSIVTPSQKQVTGQEKRANWTPILPIPNHLPNPDIQNNPYLSYMTKEKQITSLYAYKDQEGQLLGYVVRIEDKEGFKITPTLTYCQNEEGQQHWKWKGFEGSRPLYGLDRLETNKPVLIVEGEKAADAAQKILPDYAVLSWPGGAGAVQKADWSPLIGKQVTIWPDNDEAGLKAAAKIETVFNQLNQLQEKKTHVKIVDLPKDLPEKWDLADTLPKNLSLDKVKELIAPLSHNPEKELSWQDLLAKRMREDADRQMRQATGRGIDEYEA